MAQSVPVQVLTAGDTAMSDSDAEESSSRTSSFRMEPLSSPIPRLRMARRSVTQVGPLGPQPVPRLPLSLANRSASSISARAAAVASDGLTKGMGSSKASSASPSRPAQTFMYHAPSDNCLKPQASPRRTSSTRQVARDVVVRRSTEPCRIQGPTAHASPSKSSIDPGDVSLCMRLRPGAEEDSCIKVDGPHCFRFLSASCEVSYWCDHTFGPACTQEEVYDTAVVPICEAVLRGYNGAVIAYGQTGSGKTHTIMGNAKQPGVAPRVVNDIFAALAKQKSWSVEVEVMEIYNERVRDLLAGGGGVTIIDIHEVCKGSEGTTFHCPDATRMQCRTPEEALALLGDGMRRRETARTDMNLHSSRSHLVFTVSTSQSDVDLGATLTGRLHIVDLAGSERLKRAGSAEPLTPKGGAVGTPRTPRDQRRETCEINKSLSQLALVIQRLTGPRTGVTYVPYRDSVLTRLLAESFGGSSKTCLIITCSGALRDREETRFSLEFGKRAKLVKNKAQINLEMTSQPNSVVQALLATKLEHLQREREALVQEQGQLEADRKDLSERLQRTTVLLQEAAGEAIAQQERRSQDVRQLEEDKASIGRLWVEAATRAADVQDALVAESASRHEERLLHASQLQEAMSNLKRLAKNKEAEARRLNHQTDELKKEILDGKRELEDHHRGSLMLFQQPMMPGRGEKTEQVAALREQVEALHEDAAAQREAHEREMASQRDEFARELARLEKEHRAMTLQLEESNAACQRRLEDALVEKAALASKKELELTKLREQSFKDIHKLEQQSATLISELQVERRQLQLAMSDATLKSQESFPGFRQQDAARLERENTLIHKLQQEKATLQQHVQDVLREKTEALAERERELASIRDLSSQEVSRIKQERDIAYVRSEAEKASLRRRLQEALREVSTGREDETVADVSEAMAAELDQGRCEYAAFAERCAQKAGSYRQALESAVADTAQQEELREVRISTLDQEAAQLQAKWSQAVKGLPLPRLRAGNCGSVLPGRETRSATLITPSDTSRTPGTPFVVYGGEKQFMTQSAALFHGSSCSVLTDADLAEDVAMRIVPAA